MTYLTGYDHIQGFVNKLRPILKAVDFVRVTFHLTNACFLENLVQKCMEQLNGSTIVVLARDGHTMNEIAMLTKFPKATVCRVYKRSKEVGKIDTKEQDTKLFQMQS